MPAILTKGRDNAAIDGQLLKKDVIKKKITLKFVRTKKTAYLCTVFENEQLFYY